MARELVGLTDEMEKKTTENKQRVAAEILAKAEDFNREGLVLEREGKYEEARQLFSKVRTV